MNAKQALEELKWQVGNIHFFQRNEDGIPNQTPLLLTESGLFETIEQALELLDIIKRSPFVLERIFELDNKRQEYKKRYWYGTINDTELNKVKEWLTQK